MLRMNQSSAVVVPSMRESFGEARNVDLNVENWEIRSSGMVVQRRDLDGSSVRSDSAYPILLRVKYGSSCLQINVNPLASFGDLKKLLAERTGIHTDDQKLIFKKRERNSKAYLDVAGVKEGSKLVLVEDKVARGKRLLELHRVANVEKALKALKEITLEVDNLCGKVKALESVVIAGGKAMNMEVQKLIELLMTQAVKLEGIIGEGDVKQKKCFQERRVQKCVETLDQLKAKSPTPTSDGRRVLLQQSPKHSSRPVLKTMPKQLNSVTKLTPGNANKNSKLSWEIFD